MKAYILSIAGVILLSAVISVIAPSGKTGKFIKGTVRLFILAVMLAPLFGWVKKGEPPAISENAAISEDEGYLMACAELLATQDEREIEAYLREQFGVEGEVRVERGAEPTFPRKKICITLSGIIGEDGRIHIMTRVKEGVQQKFGGEVEVS